MKKIIEQTSSAASGSFETPMGSGMVRRNFHPFYDIDSEEVQGKRKKKQLNKKKKPMKKITVSEIENIILKTLIQEEVYSEKPIEPKGKDISSKNAKSQIASKTAKKVSDITAKSGKESKSDVSVRNKKVSASLKNNLKGAEVKDVNKFKKVDDDYETEAYQNGMEDIAYERISDEQKKKNMKNIVSPELRKNPNAETSEKMAKKMISQAKKRKISRDASPFSKIAASGTDIEFLPDSKKQPLPNPRKKLAFENVNTMKRLTFKSHFRDDKDMLRKIPSNYKQNDLVFEMYDGDSNYKVRWEGTETYGTGIILEHKSASLEAKNLKMFESLNKFDKLDFQSERNVQSSTLNENQMFKQMLNQSRRLMNEGPGDSDSLPTEVPSFGMQSPFIFGANTGRPLDDSGDKPNASRELMGNVKIAVKDTGLSTIVVPAPDKDKAANEAEIATYNKELNDFLKKYYGNLSLEIEWSPSEPLSFEKGRYQMKGEENSATKTTTTGSGAIEEIPTFGRQDAKIFGAGTGRPLDYAGGKGNASKTLIGNIENLIKDTGLTTVVVPAPDKPKASNESEIAAYNQQLNDFLKKYYKYSGTEVEWKPTIPLSFEEGKYQIKGESSAETGSQAKINSKRQGDPFEYKLENGKYYFRGKKGGTQASKYPNWIEATGRGLEAIKANVEF